MKKHLVLALALILTLVVSAVSADQNFMIDLATFENGFEAVQ